MLAHQRALQDQRSLTHLLLSVLLLLLRRRLAMLLDRGWRLILLLLLLLLVKMDSILLLLLMVGGCWSGRGGGVCIFAPTLIARVGLLELAQLFVRVLRLIAEVLPAVVAIRRLRFRVLQKKEDIFIESLSIYPVKSAYYTYTW